MDQLNEEIRRLQEIMGIDEMAYPVDFNFEEFRSIRSFAGKMRYAQQRLLGKVGAGSSRAVFRVDDEKVIKVAMNQKGITQNAAEAEGYKQNYNILARVFDTDEDDMWVEMELAKKVSPSRFRQLTGVSIDELSSYMRHWKGDKYPQVDNDFVDRMNDNEFVTDVMQFVQDYGYPIPGDFGRISTYGEVLRDGQPKVVVIDFGFDSSSEEIYQSARERSAARYNQRRYW